MGESRASGTAHRIVSFQGACVTVGWRTVQNCPARPDGAHEALMKTLAPTSREPAVGVSGKLQENTGTIIAL